MFEFICSIRKYINYVCDLCFDKPTLIQPIEDNDTDNTTYTMIFPYSKKNNITRELNIVFDKIYKGELLPLSKKSKSDSLYLYNDKIYKLGYTNIKQYLDVISVIQNYNIPNIVTPEFIYENKYLVSPRNDYVQIFKYYKHGDLFDYIEQNNIVLNSNEKINIFRKIINLIAPFHAKGLAHRDIKLENILVYYDECNNLQLKLIDLDFACISKNDLDFHGGSTYYVSYEVMNREKVKKELNDITDWRYVDIWSATTILYILLFNTFPWENSQEKTENKLFMEYLYYYNSFHTDSYWGRKLSSLDLEAHHLDLVFPIFKHGFDIEHTTRVDIFYIQNLLNTY